MEDISITGRAYQILRADLIGCRLKPGSRLNISALQATLSLSQASIREALSRLTAEGLVEIEQHCGFRVAPVSASGFRELIQACKTVEFPCLRTSIAKGDLEWELTLVSTYHRAVRTLELVVLGKEDIDAYANERQAFYEALLAACDNGWLLWSWRLLYAQNIRYRHMYMPLAKFERDLYPHHESFLKAVLARDVEKAVELAVQNYDRMTDFMEGQMAEEHQVVQHLKGTKSSTVKTPKPGASVNAAAKKKERGSSRVARAPVTSTGKR
jgi:GntR family carbon starvation induced transcriptional regulator